MPVQQLAVGWPTIGTPAIPLPDAQGTSGPEPGIQRVKRELLGPEPDLRLIDAHDLPDEIERKTGRTEASFHRLFNPGSPSHKIRAGEPQRFSDSAQTDQRDFGKIDARQAGIDPFSCKRIETPGTRRIEKIRNVLKWLIYQDMIQPIPWPAHKLQRQGQQHT